MAEDLENNTGSAVNETKQEDSPCEDKAGQTLNISLNIKLPSAQLPENTDSFNKMAQDAADAIKEAASFSDALARSQDFIKEIKLPTNGAANTIAKQLSDTTTGLAGSAASIADSMASITYPIQPQVYDTLKKATKNIVDNIATTLGPRLQKSLGAITDVYQKYTSRLKQTHWPLYLVADNDLYHEVLALEDALDTQSMRIEMDHIAERYLDKKWVAGIKKEWAAINLAEEDSRTLLIRALENHEHKRYMEATSILMCLFNSFYENFSSESIELTDREQEILDSLAAKYIGGKKENEGVDLKNPKSKERVLLMSVINENGWFLWEGIVSYIVDVTMASKVKADASEPDAIVPDIIEHNPIRNKICHGVQTRYDTWEHSVKAILVTDAILELNAFVQSA